MSQTRPPQAAEQKLNLRRLESIERILRYAAGAVLLVFFGLIAAAWVQLRGLNADIAAKTKERDDVTRDLDRKRAELASVKGELLAQQKVSGVLSKYSGAYIAEHPEAADAVQREVEQGIEQAVEQTSALEPAQGGGGRAVAVRLPPRVYIQIVREDQRRRASEVAAKLRAAGYIVPGIENVERKVRRPQASTLLKYFHDDDVARADVADLGQLLGGFGVRAAATPAVDDTVRPRQYEVWFGADFAPGPSPAPGKVSADPDLIQLPPDKTKQPPDKGAYDKGGADKQPPAPAKERPAYKKGP